MRYVRTMEEIIKRLEKLEAMMEELQKPSSKNCTPTFTPYKKGILASGDTRPHKEKLKSLGGKYNPTLKGWIFSKENGEKAIKEFQ